MKFSKILQRCLDFPKIFENYTVCNAVVSVKPSIKC